MQHLFEKTGFSLIETIFCYGSCGALARSLWGSKEIGDLVGKIAVLGSVNMDIVITTGRMPKIVRKRHRRSN